MERVSELGATPLRRKADMTPGRPEWEVDPNPLSRMDAQGNVFGITISLELLGRGGLEHESLLEFPPTASLTLLQDSRTCGLTQLCVGEAAEELDAVAHGQLELAKRAYPVLTPARGWIDEFGENMPSGKKVAQLELKFIFWANLLGPSYVEKLGRDFLLNAPGWRKEELSDGGVLYVVTEKYSSWRTNQPREVRDYFRTQDPRVKCYRPKSSYL